MINACLCCMLRPPDKDLWTPYARAGSTEIYSDMLEYCFQIQLTAGGICEECVEQLRDARDFRLQVECSQARLQAQLRPWPPLEDEAAGCLPETCPNEDESVAYLPETCPDEAGDKSAAHLPETCPDEASDDYGGYLPETCPNEASDDYGGYLAETCPNVASDEPAICLPKTCPDKANDESQLHGQSPIVIEIESDSEEESCTFSLASPLNDTAGPASPASDGAGPASPPSNGAGPASARARRQLAMSCCVRLERLRVRPRVRPREEPPREEPPPAAAPAPHSAAPEQGGQPYFCFFCKKQFTEISDLVAHMETHAGQKPYSCRICNKMFAIKSHLWLHSKTHKINYNRFTFDKYIKNKTDPVKLFSRKSHLIGHESDERVHSEEESYRCEVCNKLFTLCSAFLKHMRIHIGIKPHARDICIEPSQFNQFSHMRTHSGLKSYKCVVLKTKLAHSSAMPQHEITQIGYKTSYYCQECQIKFVTKSNFIEHKRTHTGVGK